MTEEIPTQEPSSELTLESLVAPEAVTEEKIKQVITQHKGKRDHLIDLFVEKFIKYQEYLKQFNELTYLTAFDNYQLELEEYDKKLAKYTDQVTKNELDPMVEVTEEEPVVPIEPTEEAPIYVPESVESWKSINYALLRAAAYPSKEEQLDMQYHDAMNGTTTWVDTLQAIKLKYPKQETV